MKQPTPKEDLKKNSGKRQSACQPVPAEHTAEAPRQSSPSSVRTIGVVSAAEEGFATGSHGTSRRSHGRLHTSMMQSRDNKRARLVPSATLDTLDNDLLIRCASYLDADGLAQLGRTSARFGIPQVGQQRSLVNEAARQLFRQSATEEENKCLPKYGDESDIGLCRALESLRRPLFFDELVGIGFSPQENPASVKYTGRRGWSTAMSEHAMRGGRHFVEFAIASSFSMLDINLGVIRPVSLTNGIDLEADWGGHVYPVLVSQSYDSALSEKLRSQRTSKW